jgi:hypothetical protein
LAEFLGKVPEQKLKSHKTTTTTTSSLYIIAKKPLRTENNVT